MPAGRQSGFTLVAVLLLLALLGLAMAAAGPTWQAQAQREREQELLLMGLAYAKALRAYREASPGTAKRLPFHLGELTRDNRFVGTVRHLRALYLDPMEPGSPWGLVLDEQGRIAGVYSQSRRRPLAAQPCVQGLCMPPHAATYAEWKFLVSEAAP